jgi:hypothetical protein
MVSINCRIMYLLLLHELLTTSQCTKQTLWQQASSLTSDLICQCADIGQGRSILYMMCKFGIDVCNIKFNTKNEEWIRIHIIIYATLLVSFPYTMCNKNVLILKVSKTCNAQLKLACPYFGHIFTKLVSNLMYNIVIYSVNKHNIYIYW